MSQISTPAVVIDEAVALRNIKNFQNYCNQCSIVLRPHIKTHKLPFFAQQQLKSGAIGITCQKIGEAEVMADAGIDDILITYNILGQDKLERLLKLSKSVKKLSVVADNATTVEGLASCFLSAPQPLRVLVECDTGAGRCGVQTPKEALQIAQMIEASPKLHFAGLMTYPPVNKTDTINSFLNATITLLQQNGLNCTTVSTGGSPDMWRASEQLYATEYRAGTYIYNDRSLVEYNTCGWDDCALTVWASVVSTPTPNRSIIDAGSKVLSSDLIGLQGYGHVLNHSEVNITGLSEEHGILEHTTHFPFSIGECIMIVPNHACVVSNLVDHVWLKNLQGEIRQIAVAARGKIT